MSNTGYPDSQRLGCQFDYIQSAPGVLKLIELLCDLLAVILGAAARSIDGSTGHKGFFLFVSILALIVTTIIFTLAMLNIRNICIPTYWPLIEVIWCSLIALLYFIASIVIATIAKYDGVYGAATFFGFAACITYIADGINNFRLRGIAIRNQPNHTFPPNMQPAAPNQPNQQSFGAGMPPGAYSQQQHY